MLTFKPAPYGNGVIEVDDEDGYKIAYVFTKHKPYTMALRENDDILLTVKELKEIVEYMEKLECTNTA